MASNEKDKPKSASTDAIPLPEVTQERHAHEADPLSIDRPEETRSVGTVAMTQLQAESGDHQSAHPITGTLGGYGIVREIGRGGMGRVYLANNLRTGRAVALKTFHPDAPHLLEFSIQRSRFENEVARVVLMDHPNIVRVFDYGEANGFLYYAMDLCSGGTLWSKIRAREVDLAGAIQAARVLALAADYLHEAGTVHRDIKPSNVLLAGECRLGLNAAWAPATPRATRVPELIASLESNLRLADFGIAKFQDYSLTRTGDVLGTPQYMSPEQVEGRSKWATPRSDVWAIGVLLYEMTTFTRPFGSGTRMELSMRIIHEEPYPPSPGYSGELLEVFSRCLRKRPEDRFQSGAELAAALDECFRAMETRGSFAAPVL